MSTSHTPGPWTIEKTSDGYGVRAPNWGYVAIHHSSGLPHWEEGQSANRLLIAAAPDLLEALTSLRAAVDRYFGPSKVGAAWPTFLDPEMHAARAAIAKATGAT